MRKVIMLLVTAVLASASFATERNASANEIGSVWKTYKNIPSKTYNNNIMMGYAGADISRKPTISFHSVTL